MLYSNKVCFLEQSIFKIVLNKGIIELL